MKKFFKFALMAVAMMAVSTAMVSCGDDDDEVKPTSTPTQTYDEYFYAVVGDQQLAYFDHSFVLNINGTTKTLKTSDMTDVTGNSLVAPITQELNSSIKMLADTTIAYKIYAYSCGKCTSGSKIQLTSLPTTLKSGHPKSDFNLLLGVGFGTKYDSTILMHSRETKINIGVGAENEADLKEFVDLCSGVTLEYTFPSSSK